MQTDSFDREMQQLEQQCIRHRRYLHAHAETGFDLHKTFDYIRSQLIDMGIAPEKCGRRGIVCTIGKPGKTFLLRADMDALPIAEETDLPFACSSGSMHACGHDMHAAMLLTAAHLLKAHEAELSGTVKLMFQPAEELLLGAQDMIDAGVLEHPRVDAALMLHVMTAQPFPPGTIIIPAPGVSAPAAGIFSVHIRGKAAHGAMPHAGVDPANAAAHILIALQEIIARELPPSDNAALTIGSLQAGDAANAIPDTAVLQGSCRAFSNETFAFIRRRTEEISTGIAKAFRAEARVEFHAHAPTLINDPELAAYAEKCLRAFPGSGKVINAAEFAGGGQRASGSEDFAAVSHRVPTLMLALAAGHPDDGYTHPLHHPRTDFDERALVSGVRVYARLAMQWLEDHK